MLRRCNGEDENLTMCVDPATGEKQFDYHPHNEKRPCDCGLVFDDVTRSTVFPHHRI